jgi:hypothetical protein
MISGNPENMTSHLPASAAALFNPGALPLAADRPGRRRGRVGRRQRPGLN